MARIAPFRAVRYNTEKVQTMEDVVSPPYDVIDSQSQAALAGKNPYNMINLDLQKSVENGVLASDRYQRARDTFMQWLTEFVLIRESEPAIYMYATEYRIPSGRQFTRKGFIALAGLAEFSEGIVKPHEKTFGGVTSDRLKLIDTCQAQFSPIFSLYSDPAGDVINCLEEARDGDPLYSVCDQDGCRHAIWAITRPSAIATVQGFFSDKALYIADGHHRYTTSLQLREVMRQRTGEVMPTSPYDHTMMYCCAMEDEGLSVLPTHRLVRIPYITTLEAILARIQENFEVEEVSLGTREDLISEVLGLMDERKGVTMLGFYHTPSDRCFLLSLKEGAMKRTCTGKHPKSLQDLDVVVLSELVLECSLDLSKQKCEQDGLIHYFADPDEAMDVAVKETAIDDGTSPVLFLMNATLVEQVRRIADEGLVMPHKSTYFYPKVLTGLVMNQLVATETIK